MALIIKNGRVLDGSGGGAFDADILIEDGVIARVDTGIEIPGAEVIDAFGRTVTPGFIDIHRHCDIAPFTDAAFGKIELAQGITTVCAGNCGLASVPWAEDKSRGMRELLRPIIGEVSHTFGGYAEYVNALADARLPVNFMFLAACNMMQTAAQTENTQMPVSGFNYRSFTQRETAAFHAYLREALELGAKGVSIGLLYQPANNTPADELTRLLKPAEGSLLTAHIRSEGNYLLEAVDEVIGIAEQAGLRLHISHFKCTGVKNWRSLIYRAFERIENARAGGLRVTADFYPYDGAATSLLTLLPPAMGGDELRGLSTRAGRASFREQLRKDYPGGDNLALSIGWDRIFIGTESKSVAALADERGYAHPEDYVADMIAAGDMNAGVILYSMAQRDVDEIARLPWVSLISDALYGDGVSHPRKYGAFPKFIREYVLERGVLTLPQAISKMTDLPAKVLGINDRGRIAPGYRADICVFKPEDFKDKATWASPREIAQGMDAVLVNGLPHSI
jgi:N-acyl-D-amino-acid deacylase